MLSHSMRYGSIDKWKKDLLIIFIAFAILALIGVLV